MKRRALLTLMAVMIMVACGPSDEPTPVPEDAPSPAEESYPAPTLAALPTSTVPAEAYPPPTVPIPTLAAYPPPTLTPAQPEAYPPPRPTPNENKRFTLSPARIGDQEVSGTGFPDTAIRIISISYAGEELGFGQIADDRSFTVQLNRPLQDEVIAVSLANSGDVSRFLDAPGTDIPMIGLVFDQVLVQP